MPLFSKTALTVLALGGVAADERLRGSVALPHTGLTPLGFFEQCWEEHAWRSVTGCSAWRDHVGHLCGDWLEGTCIAGEHHMCEQVSGMCEKAWVQPFGSFRQRVTNEHPLLFLHIPKNAGTAIEQASFDQGVNWGLHWIGGLLTLPGNKLCVKYHVPPRYLDTPVYKDAEVFCVTRHPFERAVSEYTYLLGVEWGDQFSPFLREGPSCSPVGLNSFLQEELSLFLNTTHGSKFRCDCHFLPQSEYIWDESGTQWCDHRIRMEELPGSFNQLMDAKHLPVHLKPSRVNAASCGVSPADLTEQTKAMLRIVYAEDFERLGYSSQ